MTEQDDIHLLIQRSSTFSLVLLDATEKWRDEREPHRVHDEVLRPLLAIADACWAYGVETGSDVWKSGGDILSPEKGKHRVDVSGDAIKGRELFWNAHSGKRGTIVITVPLSQFSAEAIFPHCRGAYVFDNYRAAHNAAAVRLARARLEAGTHVVFCLPRNNGIEWMDVFAPAPLAVELHAKAVGLLMPTR